VYGGAPAPPGTLERVRERLPGIALHDVYALSETCAPVTHLPDGEPLGTVGRPVPYVEVRLSDSTEIEVRSAVVTPGYWGDEPLRTTDDGWFRTGDLGSFVDGRLRTEGRAVDLILRGGVNVYPQEVERALMATGQLVEAVAYGVPSTVGGQAVAAAVVARPGVEVDVALLRRAVQEAVGVHAVPRPLRVLAELPRNANGKVDRGAL
jgi:acyl-CoA synthetase (AMP-forming)/AMP-acid ligase II